MWVGISKHGKTGICIFDGIMDKMLLSFRVFQHTSHSARQFLDDNNINWWRTSAESPDMNPIENLWHELKEFIRREVKPRRKEELVEGILKFWETVDVLKCKKYIRHLRKVIPLTIELKGAATGY